MNKIKFVDYHIHTLKHGAKEKLAISETIKAAIGRGLSLICFTDHFPLPPGFVDPVPEKDCAMSGQRYKKYQAGVKEAAKKYSGQIMIFQGAEVDFLSTYIEWTRKQIANQTFDYVLGSVHFIGSDQSKKNLILDYDNAGFENCMNFYGGIQNLIKEYFKLVREMVEIRIFDSIGHFDLVKKYNEDNKYFSENESWYKAEILKTLDTAALAGIALELNTSGIIECGEQYPSLWILKEARKRNIPLTLGSDAHEPKHIASNFKQALEITREAGYESLVYFIKRQKQEVNIGA